MSEQITEELTVGQWRQGIKSFEILYPQTKFDWDGTRQIEMPHDITSGPPHEIFDSVSAPHHITHTQLIKPDGADEQDPQLVTALFQVRICRKGERRLGTLTTWASTMNQIAPQGSLNQLEFKQAAEVRSTAYMDIDLPNQPEYADVPASMKVLEFLQSLGIDDESCRFHAVKAAKTVRIITALSCNRAEVPGILED